MLTIRTLRRASGILPLTRRLADTPTIVVFITFAVVLTPMIHDTIHAIFSFAVHVFIVNAKA